MINIHDLTNAMPEIPIELERDFADSSGNYNGFKDLEFSHYYIEFNLEINEVGEITPSTYFQQEEYNTNCVDINISELIVHKYGYRLDLTEEQENDIIEIITNKIEL